VTKALLLILTFILVNFSFSQISQAGDCSATTNAAIDDSYCVEVNVQSKNMQALAGMVVYLEPLSGQVLPISTESVVINQKNKAFFPYLGVIQPNQKVRFTNKDDITHHIYSVSEENEFALKIRSGQSNSSTIFDHSGEIAMGCNIHDWMGGYLLVIDTPYFTKTNELGIASFSNIKSGKYQVVIWHPQMQESNNRLTIEKTINENSSFSIGLTAELENIPLQEGDDDSVFQKYDR
jgi:plastocyanin